MSGTHITMRTALIRAAAMKRGACARTRSQVREIPVNRRQANKQVKNKQKEGSTHKDPKPIFGALRISCASTPDEPSNAEPSTSVVESVWPVGRGFN